MGRVKRAIVVRPSGAEKASGRALVIFKAVKLLCKILQSWNYELCYYIFVQTY